MKYYKNPLNEIFAYEEDGSQDNVISKDYVAVTKEQADELIATRTQATFNALDYAAKRRAEYPPITDYLDAVVKGDQAAIAAYIAACQAVKAKYPKCLVVFTDGYPFGSWGDENYVDTVRILP